MKILYLIHICWEWIFQRPQIIALLLEKDYEVTVVNKKFVLRPSISKNNRMPQNIKIASQLPKSDSIKFLKKINEWLYRNTIKRCEEYDAIWVCHPLLFESIPKNYKGKIIYDCMDNHVAMASEDEREKINRLEQELIERADLVFASSLKLKEVVPNMHKAVLARNGYSASELENIDKADVKELYKVGYFGTIASWFDFETLKNSLKSNKKIEYHLLGPVDKEVNVTQNEKIIFEGVIEHSKLREYVREYDALFMPFKVNDIILSVDPVKLYEYISFGKCIISVWYPEIERFEPFVYFYRNENEYNELIGALSMKGFPPKYTKQEQEQFLEENTWEYRYSTFKEQIDLLLKSR